MARILIFLRWGGEGLLKEAAKAVLLLVLFLVGGGIASIFPQVLLIGRDAKGEFSFREAANQLPGLASIAYAAVLKFAAADFYRAVVIVLVGTIAITAILLLWKFHRRIAQKCSTAWMARSHLNSIGLHGFFPVASPAGGHDSWKILIDNAKSHRTQTLRIVGATGLNTFVDPKSPLFDVVQSFKGQIDLVLMHPSSTYLAARAQSVGMSPGDYRREIERTLEYVDKLVATGVHVEVRLNNSIPSWKLAITADLCWVQYYQANAHVAETAAFVYFNNDSSNSYYQVFSWEFQRIWELSIARRRAKGNPDLSPEQKAQAKRRKDRGRHAS